MKIKLLTLSVIFFGSILFLAESRPTEAALSSQCSGGEITGKQTGCSRANDEQVLDQCRSMYSYMPSVCNSLTNYLNQMAFDCRDTQPTGINCSLITQDNYYGREAAKFAAIQEKSGANPASPATPVVTPPTVTNSCGSSVTPVNGVIEFTNPLCYNSVEEVLMALLENLKSLLVLVAIIFVVIGGMMYMFSGANEKLLEKAKSTIGGALIGLAIVLAAPSFLKQIKEILGSNWTGTNPDQIVNQALSLREILLKIFEFLLSIVGILGIIGLVFGGMMYVLAYGDEDRVELGKKIITSSLIGIAIAFGALVVVKQVAVLLGAPV
jgi:hypothetical protein